MDLPHDASLSSADLSTPRQAQSNSGDKVAVWEQACTLLRPRVGSEFDRWFGGVSARDGVEGEVIIEVPNPIHQLWIETNYGAVLQEVLREVLGGPRKVHCEVQPGQGWRENRTTCR